MATRSGATEACETADGKTDAKQQELAHRTREFKNRVGHFTSAGTIEHLLGAGYSVESAHEAFERVKDFLAGVAAEQTFGDAPVRIPNTVGENAVAAFLLQSADYDSFTRLLGTRPQLRTNGAATPVAETVPIGTS